MTNTKEKRSNRVGRASVSMSRSEASALLSGIEVALQANGGRPPDSVARPLARAVKKISDAFEFVL